MASKIIIRVVQTAFVILLFGVLFAGFARAYLFPIEINEYENRKANQAPALSLGAFLSGDFQNDLDSALSDQVFGAEDAKKNYNDLESNISYSFLSKIYEAYPDRYFEYNDVLVFNTEYLLFPPRELNDAAKVGFDLKADSINSVADKYKDIDFYAYYIEKDTDINFETGEKIGFYEYIETLIDREKCKLGCYTIDSFEEYAEKFYKIDHHWNNVGSYDGYLKICSLLGIEDAIEKGEEFLVGEKIIGSKLALAKNTESWTDSLYAYKYDFPEMKVKVNGEFKDYGNQNLTGDKFLKEEESLSYSLYFGSDAGEIVFKTGNEELDNILVIGDSFDNAVLKLLACHYNGTHSVDLRNYEHYMGKKFDFDSYVEENDIDKVLFIGNIDYFILEEFNVG